MCQFKYNKKPRSCHERSRDILYYYIAYNLSPVSRPFYCFGYTTLFLETDLSASKKKCAVNALEIVYTTEQ